MQLNKKAQPAELNKEIINQFFAKLTDGMAFVEQVLNNSNEIVDFVFKNVNKSFEIITDYNNNNIVEKKISEVFSISELSPNSINLNSHSKLGEYYSLTLGKLFDVLVFPFLQSSWIVILVAQNEINNSTISNKGLSKINETIRITSNILLREKNKDILLENICISLSELLPYKLVWISSFKNSNKYFKQFYCSDSELLINLFNDSSEIPCIESVLKSQETILLHSFDSNCTNCSLESICKAHNQFLVPLVFNNVIYGVLAILISPNIEISLDEKLMFRDLSKDIGFALFNIEVQEELENARKKVRDYYQEIDNQNKLLVKLNTDLKTSNEHLKLANEKANESEMLKSTFLANISHEIRTPLNGILGFIQLLKQANSTPEKLDEYIDIITFSGSQLLSTINSILDISKIESGQLSVDFSKCNIQQIFDELLQSFKNEVTENDKIELISEINGFSNGLDFYSDEGKLKQIVHILLHNAFKFSKNGYVKLGAKQEDDYILIYVEDTGIGIDKDKFKLIFDSFRQSDESNTRKHGGVGLGLAIAKGLVDLLKGEIWLESELDKGTTFYFKVPYLLNKNNEKTNKAMDLDKIETLDWSSKKILIVEDDMFSAEYLAEALSITNVKVVFAKNGSEAVDLAKTDSEIDLILMDIQLPGLSGDKATRIIREFNPEIPIIAQTAHAMLKDKDGYIKAGCTDYISKPISMNELYSVLCKYI